MVDSQQTPTFYPHGAHPHETMNYLSYDVLSLLSSITLTNDNDNDDDDDIDENEVVTTTTNVVRVGHQTTATTDHDSANAGDATANHIVPSVLAAEEPVRSRTNSNMDNVEFQIRATIHSWSFCWNRGDIVGYCDAYYDNNSQNNNNNNNDTRYVSVGRNGKLTTVIGYTNIQQFLTTVFHQCERHQSKVQQQQQQQLDPLEASLPPVNGRGVAGYLEYHHLHIQYIPGVVVDKPTNGNYNHNDRNDEFSTTTNTATTTATTNHAMVFGHYTLEYSRHHHSKNERGVFTLHLIQNCRPFSKWQIQSEHSSAIP